jgi:hypothetical protein
MLVERPHCGFDTNHREVFREPGVSVLRMSTSTPDRRRITSGGPREVGGSAEKRNVPNSVEAVREAMLNGTPGQRKALLKELIVEVRVENRDSIIPTFRLPATSVRVTESMVGRGGLEPPTSALRGPERCA